MAQRHPSAVKRNRQNQKQRVRNRAIRTTVRNEVRETNEIIARRDIPASEAQLRAVVKTISKAVSKGVLHKNAASRRIARLSKHVAALKKAS